MKKLLAIVALGLLCSNSVFAEKIVLYNCYVKNFEPKGTTDNRIEIDKNNSSLLWIIEKDKTWVENKNKELQKNKPKSSYRHKLKETFKHQIVSVEDKVLIARDDMSEFAKEELEEYYKDKNSFISEIRVNLNNNTFYFKSYYINPPHYRSSSVNPAFCKKK